MIFTRTIGIDLGTTNSAVAMLEANEQDLLLCKDAQGRSTTPSCVWRNPRTGDIVVGHRAYARKGTTPEPISSIKRSMGTQMTVTLGDKQFTPAEISAFILHELKQQIESELQTRSIDGVQYEVNRAIITVPAYFDLSAIEATRQAGELAGLEVTELLHEPTAAAIYYGWKHDLGDGVYLVYDLGGGTFDVSILRRTAGEFLVLGISGNNFLGGDDFDRRLAEHLRAFLVDDGYELDLDVAADPEDLLRFNQLVALAERAKQELSEKDEIILRDQGSLKDKAGLPVIIETSITRSSFESLIDDLLDRTIACCQEALTKAREKGGITIENIDHILLVGGSTYVPAVMKKVKEALCQNNEEDKSIRCVEPIRDEPENAVALGAALRAASAGLGIGDDERNLRIWFRGSGATKRERATISGHIEPLRENLALEDGAIHLSTSDGEELGEALLKPGLRFVFPRIELAVESLNEFRFEVLDNIGNQVAVLQRSIMQAADQKETVGSALSTSVLPKPIVLEGTDGDRLVRRVLLSEGTSLPANAHFTFAVNDPNGQIRLPIYQANRIIKELQANVGKVTVGTPVEVDISCDEQVNIHVKFSLGEQDFGGMIAPPPPDVVPTEYEIQQIDSRFGEVVQALDEEDARHLISMYERARQDLHEARAGADYPKVIQRAKDLEGLIREARMAEPLRPPLNSLEENYTSCLELLPQAVKIKPELATSSFQESLDKTMEAGKQAYKQRDRETYADAVQIINTSLQFLVNLTRVDVTDNKEVNVSLQAVMLFQQTRQMIQFLFLNCLLTKQTDFLTALKEYLEELDSLEERIASDPVGVSNRCQVLMTEAKRIYQAISPDDKMTKELEGLLKLDAHSRTPDFSMPENLFNQ